MAVTAKWYGQALLSAFNKEINLGTDVLKVMLCTSSYIPDQDAHRYKSSVTNEVVGTGYTATGQALTSVTVTYNASTNTVMMTAAATTWASSTITARYAVIYDSSPATDATRPLLCYVDFGADVVSASGAFTITWDATGILVDTVA